MEHGPDYDREQDDDEREFESAELPEVASGEPIDVAAEELAGEDEPLQDGEFAPAIDGESLSASPAEASPTELPERSPMAAEPVDRIQPGDPLAHQERLRNPLGFSPITGERAPPGTFYLPQAPPRDAGPTKLPFRREVADNSAANGPAEAPENSRRNVPERPIHVNPAPSAADELPPREDLGPTMPRVQVVVSLASARALFDDALEEASRQMAERFRKLALGEIEFAEFRRKAAARAADYSLRGPTFR